jgi:hypothetical protein
VAIGTGWAEGAWVDAGWVTTGDGAWSQVENEPVGAGGGGSWDPHARHPSLAGIKLRRQPFKSQEVEEEVEEVVEEVIEEVEQIEEPDSLARQSVIRTLRKTEKISQRMAEAQIESRVNELISRRRLFFESENEDMRAILFILSEIL